MRDFAVLACRFGLSILFLLAGLSKIRDRSRFAKAIEAYKLVPRASVDSVALWLPSLELLAGVALAVGFAQGAVAATVAVMLAAFAGAVGVNLMRGRRIDCGCIGGEGQLISWWTVARNLGLIGAAAVVWRWPSSSLTLFSHGPSDVPIDEALAVLVSSIATVLILLLIHEARRVGRGLRTTPGRSGS